MPKNASDRLIAGVRNLVPTQQYPAVFSPQGSLQQVSTMVAMMRSPEDAVRACRLDEALRELPGRVRAKPGESKDRVFLFQLLSVLGQWDRAKAQLDVAADLDASVLILKQIYAREILFATPAVSS